MKKEKLSATIMIAVLFIASCSKKEVIAPQTSTQTLNNSVIATAMKPYCEALCNPTSRQGAIQKKCINANGNCRKLKDCSTVSFWESVDPPSLSQINTWAVSYADWMRLNDYIDAEDWVICKDGTYNELVAIYYP
jgi:hypothetical protein